jgi:cysteine desulfuration protein SufE
MDWLDEQAEDLQLLTERQRLEYVLDIAKSYEGVPESERVQKNEIAGCNSKTHCTVSFDPFEVRFASASLIVHGYLSFVGKALTKLGPRETSERGKAVVEDFVARSGLEATLTPSRSNAFGNAVRYVENLLKEKEHISTKSN